jgi:flavin-binding protein dodecin
MTDKVYQVIQLVGSSQQSIEDAINNALEKAGDKCGKLDWFEVAETRGFIEGNKAKYYQVTLNIGANL